MLSTKNHGGHLDARWTPTAATDFLHHQRVKVNSLADQEAGPTPYKFIMPITLKWAVFCDVILGRAILRDGDIPSTLLSSLIHALGIRNTYLLNRIGYIHLCMTKHKSNKREAFQQYYIKLLLKEEYIYIYCMHDKWLTLANFAVSPHIFHGAGTVLPGRRGIGDGTFCQVAVI